MSNELLESEYGKYREHPYEVRVYFSPASNPVGMSPSPKTRLVIVKPTEGKPGPISTVRDHAPLEPTSIEGYFPWNSHPDPVPTDEHKQRAIEQFESLVDEYERAASIAGP